jgi:hypothetical protein
MVHAILAFMQAPLLKAQRKLLKFADSQLKNVAAGRSLSSLKVTGTNNTVIRNF